MTALASNGAAAWRVKPVEWEGNRADIYTVAYSYGGLPKPCTLLRASTVVEFFDTRVEVMAAAQADHEQRINSALIPAEPSATPSPAAGQAQPVGEREAFERWAKAVMLFDLDLCSEDGEYASILTRSAWLAWQAARRASSVIPVGEQTPTVTGVKDKNGTMLRLGDRVRYRAEGPHTKREYWNPEYEIVWDAPRFTLRHVGGGADGGAHDFKLKYGGSNGDLELIQAASPPTVPGVEITEEAYDHPSHLASLLAGHELVRGRLTEQETEDFYVFAQTLLHGELNPPATHIHKATGVEYRLVGVGRVKPLQWIEGTFTSTDDDNGPMEGIPVELKAWRAWPYTIIKQRSADGRYILRGKSDGVGLVVTRLDEAMRAAQADFDLCFEALPGDGEGKL